MIYDDVIWDGARDGAEVYMFQTNNADFRGTDENLQQLAFARMRAIETGRSVVNLSTVGTSQVIAPDGTTIDGLPADEAGHMLTDVPLRTGLTPAVVAGEGIKILLGWGSLARPHRTGRRSLVRAGGAAAADAKTPAPEGTGVTQAVRRQALILSPSRLRRRRGGRGRRRDALRAALRAREACGARAACPSGVRATLSPLWSTVAVPSPMRSRASAPHVRHSHASGTSASAAKVMVVSRPQDVHV